MSVPARVQVEWVSGHRFEARRDGAPPIRLDGDSKAGPSPVDALLAALATCVAVDVVDILAKRRTPVESLTVDVDALRVDSIPRHIERVTLNFHISGAEIERVHAERAIDLAMNKYCSVRDSLRPDVPIDWTLELR